MRIEKLAGDKVKVTLTSTDLVNFDIDINRLAPDSKELHTFLFRIMETIIEETGFNPYNGQVVVEATPSEGGISILVSKIKALHSGVTREEIKKGVKIRARMKKTSETVVYYFKDFDDLCCAITQIDNEALSASALYRLGNTYCFILKKPLENLHAVAVMSEFASGKAANPMQYTYIKEHGDLIAKREGLCSMADNIRMLG